MIETTETKKQEWGPIVLGLMLMPLTAWITTTLWRWFAVPLGLPSIGLWHSVGLVAIWGMFKPTDRKAITYERILEAFSGGMAMLGIGALAHWLMVR